MLKKKLIVILGPTSSGKSDLAVKLAQKFNGEVISADSRQVYKGMNIGTGKITKKEMKGIPHYLLDVASPKKRFTVAQYQKLALAAINKIYSEQNAQYIGRTARYKKGKIPILCGGTGFYIQAVVEGIAIPKVKPDWKLRKRLQKKSNEELFELLKKLDPKRAKNIDKHNPRRLIRALEIVLKTKKPIPSLKTIQQFDVLMIGIKKTPAELKKRIKQRLLKRLKQGMVAEIKKLRKSGLSWKKLEDFGSEYRWISRFLQKKISYQEMIERLQKNIEHFAKRQMTWFSAHGGSASGGKRDKRIKWIKNRKEAEKLAEKFLNKNPSLSLRDFVSFRSK